MKNTQNQRPISGKNVGTVQGRGVNEASKQNSARSSHNSFPNSYDLSMTARYGDLTPFYVSDAHAKDITPLYNHHLLKSFALKSPLMSRVRMHKDYFEVPLKAILPRTFEMIYNNPSQGDDVPSDAYCFLDKNFFNILNQLPTTNFFFDNQDTLSFFTAEYFAKWIKSLLLFESIFSKGSLLTYLGCPLYHLLTNVSVDSSTIYEDHSDDASDTISLIFDVLENNGYSILFVFDDYSAVNGYGINTNEFTCSKSTVQQSGAVYVSRNRLLELLRSNSWSVRVGAFDIATIFQSLVNDAVDANLNFRVSFNENIHVDISRLLAYQLVCSHFYTNDSVDFVYSADKYRKACESIFLSGNGPYQATNDFFTYNGEKILYDVFSNHIFSVLSVNSYEQTVFILQGFNRFYDFFSNIFFYRRSLKFGDYFVGARPYPLAVGDNTVYANLDDGSINPIEVVRSIQGTRFLNAVNRSGPRVQDYLAQIYGTVPAPCDTDPKFISRQTSTLSGFDVNNTADQQGKQTAMFSDSSDSKRAFAFEVNTEGFPSILIGIMSFDMKRLFADAVDRSFFKKDRFDFFNPYFQYEGDQALLSAELGIFANTDVDDDTFAYTLRDMQYKQRLNRAVGGFISRLPSWTNVVENSYEQATNISPEFIRSSSTEFDKFFESLTGNGLANYFHFIIAIFNESETLRAMEYQPAILNG